MIFADNSVLLCRTKLLCTQNDLHQHLVISHSNTDLVHLWSAYKICRDHSTGGHSSEVRTCFQKSDVEAIAQGTALPAVTFTKSMASASQAQSPQTGNKKPEQHLNHMPASDPHFQAKSWALFAFEYIRKHHCQRVTHQTGAGEAVASHKQQTNSDSVSHSPLN